MTKTLYYKYLGTNGVITSTVHLEDIYYVRQFLLQADELKSLTKDGKNFCQSIMVGEDEVDDWKEV